MANTYVSPGEVLEHTAAADLNAGEPVIVGDVVGVALVDIATGETGAVAIRGRFAVPKAAGTGLGWTQGTKLNFDSATGKFTTQAAGTGDVKNAAIAAATATDAATAGEVILTPDAAEVQ